MIKLPLALKVVVFAAAVAVSSVFLASNALAGGAVGGAGGASGCASCPGVPHTNNGFGWYIFSSSGAGPADVSGGGSWANISQRCRDTGNELVVAFVVLRPSGGVTNSRIYEYSGGFIGTYPNFLGNNGGNWRNHSQASALFYSLPASLRAGYTFGSNVAWFCYSNATTWNINGQSYVQINSGALRQGTITAQPGQRLHYYHDLRNSGPENMDRNVNYYVQKSGFRNNWDAQTAPAGSGRGGVNVLFMTAYATNGAAYTIFDVQQDDVGGNLCQRVVWSPGSSSNNSTFASGYACASIPYNYALTPTISNISNGAIVESELGSIPVNGHVAASGPTKSHTGINWQVTELRFAPGATLGNSGGGTSGSNPCAYFTGEAACSNLSSGSRQYAQGASITHAATGTLGAQPVGTRLCYAMSVQRNSSGSTEWRHSRLYCLVVGKQPKVHVTGGDLVVGRETGVAKVSTGYTRKGTTYYGSWSEYAIIPSGLITGMSTGSGYAGGTTTADLCAHHRALAFTNYTTAGSCNSAANGGYVSQQSSPAAALQAQFSTTSTTPAISGNVNVNSISNRQVYRATGNLTLTAPGMLGQNQWVVINAGNYDVTIASNIVYATSNGTGNLNRANEIPQVVIIARNIIINDNVSQVDSWLVATGTGANGYLKTCDAPGVTEPAQLRDGVCNTPLRINGPVVANHLQMYRTAGAGTGGASDDPAEVFNLRPDAYLWARSYQLEAGVAQTVDVKELPPRY